MRVNWKTYSEEVQEGFLVSFPQITRYVFPKGGLCFGTKLFEGRLRVRSQTETSTYLDPHRRRLVDLKVNMRMLEKSESKSDSANATADDGKFETCWG